MSLKRYVENAWLRRKPTSPQEIVDQLGIVAPSIKDASLSEISDDLRFYTTFNAVLTLANTALRARGYLTITQPGHHTRTTETLEYTIGAEPKLIAFSKKRNVASFDSAGFITNQELKDILVTAEDLRHSVETWLWTNHPKLPGRL